MNDTTTTSELEDFWDDNPIYPIESITKANDCFNLSNAKIDADKLNFDTLVQTSSGNSPSVNMIDFVFNSNFMVELKSILTDNQLYAIIMKYPESMELFRLSQEQRERIEDFLNV